MRKSELLFRFFFLFSFIGIIKIINFSVNVFLKFEEQVGFNFFFVKNKLHNTNTNEPKRITKMKNKKKKKLKEKYNMFLCVSGFLVNLSIWVKWKLKQSLIKWEINRERGFITNFRFVRLFKVWKLIFFFLFAFIYLRWN